MKSKAYVFVMVASSFLGQMAHGRSIFLNGTDISSAKVQYLKKVDIRIDERGDLHIIAPHYQVHEENTFVPLSAGRVRVPVHENQPLEYRKEGSAPGVVPQFMHGTDKTAKTAVGAEAIKNPQSEPTSKKDEPGKPLSEIDSNKSATGSEKN